MSRADLCCPRCDSSDVFSSGDSDTFTCSGCGLETHEKVIENREALEELAESDLPLSDLANLALEGSR